MNRYHVWCENENAWVYSSSKKKEAVNYAIQHSSPPTNHTVRLADFKPLMKMALTKLFKEISLKDIDKYEVGKHYDIVKF